MKTHLIIIASLLISVQAFSQEKSNTDFQANKNEISISAGNLFGTQQIIYPYYGAYYDLYLPYYYGIQEADPQISIWYKRNFGQQAIRFGLGGYYNSNQQDESPSDYEYKQSQYNYVFNLGYEKHINIKRVQFYFGGDLSFGIYNYNSSSEYNYENTIDTYESESETISYGVSPFAGVKIFIFKNLSLSAETKYNLESWKQENTSKSNNYEDSTNKTSGIHSGFGPAATLSLNFHF